MEVQPQKQQQLEVEVMQPKQGQKKRKPLPLQRQSDWQLFQATEKHTTQLDKLGQMVQPLQTQIYKVDTMVNPVTKTAKISGETNRDS